MTPNLEILYNKIVSESSYPYMEDEFWLSIRDISQGRVVKNNILDVEYLNRKTLDPIFAYYSVARVRDSILFLDSSFIEGKDYIIRIS